MRRELAFLVRASSGAVGIALLAELPLLVCFSINNRLVGADVENEVSSPGWEDRETRETRRIWWQIQVVVLVLRVYDFSGHGTSARICARSLAIPYFSDHHHVDVVTSWSTAPLWQPTSLVKKGLDVPRVERGRVVQTARIIFLRISLELDGPS